MAESSSLPSSTNRCKGPRERNFFSFSSDLLTTFSISLSVILGEPCLMSSSPTLLVSILRLLFHGMSGCFSMGRLPPAPPEAYCQHHRKRREPPHGDHCRAAHEREGHSRQEHDRRN